MKNIDKKYFKLIEVGADYRLYSEIVYSKALKRKIDLVYQEFDKGRHKLYFSTDETQEALEIFKMYKCRFQIEFLFRDAKQHTGLNDCQARCPKKMYFHYNA